MHEKGQTDLMMIDDSPAEEGILGHGVGNPGHGEHRPEHGGY